MTNTGNCRAKLINYSLNIRSLQKNISELRVLATDGNPDTICIQETWLKDEKLVTIPNYNLHHASRPSRGGGVAIYIKNNLDLRAKSSLINEHIELITVDLKHLTLINLYRPPKGDINIFLTMLTNHTNRNCNSTKKTMIVGDFNINLDKSDSTSEKLLNMMATLGYQQSVSECTRTDMKSSTLLDHCYTNFETETQVRACDISDHDLVIAKTNIKKPKNSPPVACFRVMKQDNIDRVKVRLNGLQLNQTGNEPQVIIDNMVKQVVECYDAECPIIEANSKRVTPLEPWYSKGLLISRATKLNLLKQARSTKTEYAWHWYKQYRNLYTRVIKQAKLQHYHKQLQLNDSKVTWNVINELLGRKKEPMLPGTPNQQLAEDMNNHFIHITTKMAQTNPTNHTYRAYLKELPTYAPMQLKLTNPLEVEELIEALKPKKSNGPDLISNILLKKTKSYLAPQLTNIINYSILQNVFPNQWKCAKVVPIYKKGEKTEFGNYRPISLLPTMSKIIEKVIERRIRQYLQIHNILPPSQYGFRHGHDTTQATLNYINKIYENKHAGKTQMAIFLDLQKAFDTVDHNILIWKLKRLGLPAEWFMAYLNNRCQTVQIDKYSSSPKSVTTGVPQGSILGPILFIIYLADLEYVSTLAKILFADDTTLIGQTDNQGDLAKTIQKEIDKVVQWFKANKLSIHPKKTTIMSPWNKSPDNQHIEILGTKLYPTTEPTKFLGLLIAPNMSWQPHVVTLTKKLRLINYNLARVKRILPTKTKLLIYNSLFKSTLEYGILAWGDLPKHLKKSITTLQKKAIRLVAGEKQNAHTDPIFAKLRVLKFEDLYELKCIKLREKLATDPNTSHFIKTIFTPYTHNYSTRSKMYQTTKEQTPLKNIISCINRTEGLPTKQYFTACINAYSNFSCKGCPACKNVKKC